MVLFFFSKFLFIPDLSFQRGPNKVPVYSLCVVTAITLIFIFVGDVNTLGPIVTMPFMLTYAAVDYCYFTLAMSFRKRRCRHARFTENSNTLQGGKHGYSPVHVSMGEMWREEGRKERECFRCHIF